MEEGHLISTRLSVGDNAFLCEAAEILGFYVTIAYLVFSWLIQDQSVRGLECQATGFLLLKSNKNQQQGLSRVR